MFRCLVDGSAELRTADRDAWSARRAPLRQLISVQGQQASSLRTVSQL